MKYTIGQLAKVSGVTTRTLRYYDEIGLLKPSSLLESGYRIYNKDAVAILHQILMFREFGFELQAIKEIIQADQFNQLEAMEQHLERLAQEKVRLNHLMEAVQSAMKSIKEDVMMDEKQFKAFKKEMIDKNEAQYGEEIRSKYGEDTIDRSNQKMANMSQEDYRRIEELVEEMNVLMREIVPVNEPASDEGQKLAALHAEWLKLVWPEGLFDEEKHLGLVQMYTLDECFKAYYEKVIEGAADYLYEAVKVYYNK